MNFMKNSRRVHLVVLAAFCVLSLMLAQAAHAEEHSGDFWLQNQTSFPFASAYIYRSDDEGDLEEKHEVLKGQALGAGKKRMIGIGVVGAKQLYTLILQDKSGNAYLFSGFRLSEILNIHVTYSKGVCKIKADNGQTAQDTKD